MKKVLFTQLIWLLLIFPLAVKGQWAYSVLLTPNYPEGLEANSLFQMPNNDFIVAGNASPKAIVIKFDIYSNVLWNKTFKINNNYSQSMVLNQAISCFDSSIIAIGNYADSITAHSVAICMKLDKNGDSVWVKSFKPTGASNVYPYSVLQTYDSGFIIIGSVSYGILPIDRSFAAKFDAAGNLQWAKQFLGSNNCTAYSVKQTPDTGYVITGHFGDSHGAFALKLFSNGDISWAKKYVIDSYYGNDVILVNNGMIFSADNNMFKTDFSGNVLWGKTYNKGYGFHQLRANRIHQTHDGGFVFITSSTCQFQFGSKIVRTDSIGNQIWSDDLELIALDAVEIVDSGYLIIGNGPMCTAKQNGNPIGLIITDTTGFSYECVSPNTDTSADLSVVSSNITFTTTNGVIFSSIKPIIDTIQINTYFGCVGATGAVRENTTQNNNITISPNPFSTNTQITLSQTYHTISLSVYDIQGKLVAQNQYADCDKIQLNRNTLTNGMYFLKLIMDDKEITTGKIVVSD